MIDLKDEYFTYLEPKYDGAKSFYKKARVYHVDACLYLVSYETIVAKYEMCSGIEIYPDKDTRHKLYNGHSKTTRRHIKEFMRQLHLDYSEYIK